LSQRRGPSGRAVPVDFARGGGRGGEKFLKRALTGVEEYSMLRIGLEAFRGRRGVMVVITDIAIIGIIEETMRLL
jgi:hypothetical protein